VNALIDADRKSGLKKFSAKGFTELKRNGQIILSFRYPVDIYIEKQNNKYQICLVDKEKI